MGQRVNGGVIGVSNMPTTSKASGVWTLKEVALYKKAGLWPSAATFSLAVDSATVNKGSSFTVTLTTTGVADGTLVPYTITGIASGDLSSGSLTGNITVTSNTGSVTFTTATSGGTSGDLTATFSCGGQTTSISIKESDTYFKYVTALLHGDGTNAAQNNTFVDSSTNNFTITRNGDTTQGTFSPFGDTWSNYFDGSGDYLTSTAAAFGSSGDLTVEAWVYPTASGVRRTIYFVGNTGTFDLNIFAEITASNTLRLLFRNDSATDILDISSVSTVTANTWSHVAFVLSGTGATIYLNGTSVATGTVSGTRTGTFTTGSVGALLSGGATHYMTGYISNLRYVKGTAVYTGSFTPSTTPLTAVANTSVLTCQSNRFKDNSSNGYTITKNGDVSVQKFSPFSPTAAYSTSSLGGSAYFDGSGDYLLTPSTGQFAPAGDFTIGLWVYPTAFSAYNVPLANFTANVSTDWEIEIQSNGSIVIYTNGSTPRISASSGTVKLNQWQYIAIVRSGSTITAYYNGSSFGTYSQSGTFGSATKAIGIGAQPAAGGSPFAGYISGVLLIDGSAVTSVPSTPSTAVSGTSLLLNFTNGGIIDNAMMNDLQTVGNVQVSTSVKKYGTGSLYFDGTGDYLVSNSATTDLYAFGTGDFTIEMWVNFAVVGSSGVHTLYDSRPNGSQGAYASIALDRSTAKIYYYVSSAIRITGTTSISANTWYHVAICRSGTNTKLFVNGTQDGSTWTDSTTYLNPASRPVIAASGSSIGNEATNGYIDDLRVTKGYARYTTTFTPPTGAFQDR